LLTIEQTRFLADGSKDDTYRWKIPINICTQSSPNRSVYQLFLNGEKKQEFLLENLAETDWIKLNLFRFEFSPRFSARSFFLVWASIVFTIHRQCSNH